MRNRAGIKEGLPGDANYSYDGVGRVIEVDYGHSEKRTLDYLEFLNLPRKIQKGNSTIENYYTAEGQKYKSVRSIEANGAVEETETVYIGDVELVDGSFLALNHEEGRIVLDETQSLRKEFFLKDHLGNIRVRFADLNADGNIAYELPAEGEESESELLTSHHFYPFGLEWKGRFYEAPGTAADQRPRYNGKEWEQDVGLYDYGARWYDPAVGRFLSVDPMAHKREWLTPYNFVSNNPINRVDPTGALDDWIQKEDGSIEWDDNVTSADDADLQKGDTYLGEDLTFTFNSYISDSYDGPPAPWEVTGDKLTSTITLDATKNADGSLKSVSVSSSDPYIGETGGYSIFKGRDYFPGLGDNQNQAINLTDVRSFNATYEQHASVPGIEAFMLSAIGYDAVNVAQRLNMSLSGNQLSIKAATDVFPSATLSVNGIQLFQYDQPSFKATHGRDYRMYGEHIMIETPRRPAPNFYNRYKK